MIFFFFLLQIVKNSTTVGRRMTTGSDSLPLVSFSDTYPPLRNRNNSSYVEGPRWVTAGRDSGSGGLTTLRDGRGACSHRVQSDLLKGQQGSGTISRCQ